MLNMKKLLKKILVPQKTEVIPPQGVTFSRNRLYKIGHTVFLEVEHNGALSAGAYRALGSLPSGYFRTDADYITTGQIFLTSGAYIKVDTNGGLYVYPQTNVPTVYLNFAFVVE